MVILNSASVVKDLSDKRGPIYSSRPPIYIGTELSTQDDVHLLLMPCGPEWRNQRKVYQSILNINAIMSLRPLQAAEATHIIKQLLDIPQDYYDHLRRYSMAVKLSSVFGVWGPELITQIFRDSIACRITARLS